MPALVATRPRAPSPCMGPSALVHMAYAGADLGPLTNALIARSLAAEPDPGAAFDLATVLLSRGGALAVEGGRLMQQAVAVQPSYEVRHGDGRGVRVLALVTMGDFMANTPVDFLLAGSNATLILHHVDARTKALDLPPHDVAFVAIGESEANRPVLAQLARLLAEHRGPVLNNAPGMIAGLTRDKVSDLLAGEGSILAPRTRRVIRSDPRGLAFPLTIRPTGSHAGEGLALVAHRAALDLWWEETGAEEAFVAPFVDYRGKDGLYTKQRVVMIGGRAFASHQASSTHWMVHYLNAEMADHPARRKAEAEWMAGFDRFAARHARAFAALHRIFGLDYFGIDCAEAPDGRLLVFEVDTAMIVHDMDDEALFPHKKPAMRRVFGAFLAMVEGRVG